MKWLAWVPKTFGVREVHVYGGLTVAAWGLSQLAGVGYALVMAGAVLFWMGWWGR